MVIYMFLILIPVFLVNQSILSLILFPWVTSKNTIFKGGLNPLTPRSKFVILITVNHTVLTMLVQRIQYWIN